jgi:hypothetical protein
MTKLRQLKFSSLVTKEVTKVHKGQFMPPHLWHQLEQFGAYGRQH